ncbi:hypothetical protein [Marinovum sp.]|uniref:hypothetical protein n=1 Tax=Marinovum sp. TaxID=2024839 RepID=UPI002B26E0C0|nr:hypothetical protein [Marinovum sp.]
MYRPCLAVGFLVVMTCTAALAAPPPAGDRAEAFAVCAGRLSALSVRQAAEGDPASAVTGQMSADFDMLLAAVLPEADSDTQAQRWRVDGWLQIAHLLARNQYADTPRRRDLAAVRMAQRIDTCRRMILGR